MITVIGVGSAGANVANRFTEYPQYRVYKIGKGMGNSHNEYEWAPKSLTPESIEEETPTFKDFFKQIDEEVYFIIAGDSLLSNATLAILEQIKTHKISIFYLHPDTNLLTPKKKLQNRAIFNVLQEYTRSGLFESLNVINNYNYENILGSIPIKNYWENINATIVSSIHMMNVFRFSNPILGKLHDSSDISRIRTFGIVGVEDFEEKLFFQLDNVREKRYYIGINETTLETDNELYTKILNNINQKSEGGEVDVSYAIYPTKYDHDLVYCEHSTHFIQT